MVKWSGKPHSQRLARKIFLACNTLNIRMVVEWMPRMAAEMVTADIGSRGLWATQEVFQLM